MLVLRRTCTWRTGVAAALSMVMAVAGSMPAQAGHTPGAAAASSAAACRGGGGGSTGGVGDVDLVYAIDLDTSGVDLAAGVLVRGPAEWHRLPPPEARPDLRRPDGMPRLTAGSTVGPLWVQHEREGNTLWLDDQPLPLGEANVVLLEIGAGGRPRVVGTARVESRLPLASWSCRMPATRDEAEAFDRALWQVVRRAPAVRAFLDR